MPYLPKPPWARGGRDPTIGLYPSLLQPEVLHLSPLSPGKREVGREKTVMSTLGRVRDEATPGCYLNCPIS